MRSFSHRDRREKNAATLVGGEVTEGIYVGFSDWTGLRKPLVLGTNAGAQPLAFQNWRRFKESFAPELINQAVQETSASLGRGINAIIDPFAGSGTTLLASQFLGINSIGIEVNPYLADLTEAKLTVVDSEKVAWYLTKVLTGARSLDPHEFYKNIPKTFIEPGVDGRYLFRREVASRLAGLLEAIMQIRIKPIQRLLRVLLGSAALEVCNAIVSGKGRRYRRNWQEREFNSSDLERAFARIVETAVFDATRYARRRSMSFTLLRGDAREKLKEPLTADIAIFSPPYPNSFDYTDVYNIELWILRYLRGRDENAKLRNATLRSHVQIKRDMSSIQPVAVIADAIAQLRAVPKLWNRAIPDMIGAYFSDLNNVLADLNKILVSRGRVYMVVGDSRYSGVNIPVAAGLVSLATDMGYSILKVDPFRSMRSSPQQGGAFELAESLIILEKT